MRLLLNFIADVVRVDISKRPLGRRVYVKLIMGLSIKLF
jgi:hypothetical protein